MLDLGFTYFLSICRAGMLSESEQEDDPSAQIVLPQTLSSRGARADGQSAVRLSELGPRLTLQLVKIEDGLMDGEVLFHEFINKTEDEKEEIRKKRDAKRLLFIIYNLNKFILRVR